jgi:FAD:protein FMN transferase
MSSCALPQRRGPATAPPQPSGFAALPAPLRSAVFLAALYFLPLPAAGFIMALESEAFGAPLRLEIVDLPPSAGDAALGAGLEAVREVEAAVQGEPLARLQEAAGVGPVPLSPPLGELLARAQAFCLWSEGRHGPLGGRLYELWGLRQPVSSLPTPTQRADATAQARCDRLTVDSAAATATLSAGARIELWGFARGFAVDRALAALVAAGADNASVTLGPLQRSMGKGPQGDGWPIRIAMDQHLHPWLSGLRLVDQALAVASATQEPLRVGGERFAPYVDQTSGLPGRGVLATAAVSELAVDAEGVAVTAFLAGNRPGSHLMGQLRPAPAVLWLLGSGEGDLLVMDFRWSAAGLRRHGNR